MKRPHFDVNRGGVSYWFIGVLMPTKLQLKIISHKLWSINIL